jgi:hypothetical protein
MNVKDMVLYLGSFRRETPPDRDFIKDEEYYLYVGSSWRDDWTTIDGPTLELQRVLGLWGPKGQAKACRGGSLIRAEDSRWSRSCRDRPRSLQPGRVPLAYSRFSTHVISWDSEGTYGRWER